MTAARAGWSAALLVVVAVPVLPRLQPGAGVWLQLAELTGLLATSALVMTVVLPSRVRSLTRAFGVDGVHLLHRAAGVTVVGLVLIHLACVVAADPTAVALLNPATATSASKAAMVSALALGALLTLTVIRQRQRYEVWRWAHLSLTAAAVVGATLHIWYLGRLVNDPTMRVVFTSLAAVVAAVGVWRWGLRPRDPSTGFLVAAVRPQSPTVSSIFLEPARSRHRLDEPAMPHLAGQFAWLRLASHPQAQEHPFTIASGMNARRVELVIRHRGDFTRAIRSLPAGRRVWLDGPHGAFTVDDTMSRVAMVCSGVGIAPMLSILRTAADRGDRRPHLLIQYAARPDDMLFREELKDLAERIDLELLEVDEPDPIGAARAATTTPERWHWFVCGPPQMVRATETALSGAGVPITRINTEHFD